MTFPRSALRIGRSLVLLPLFVWACGSDSAADEDPMSTGPDDAPATDDAGTNPPPSSGDDASTGPTEPPEPPPPPCDQAQTAAIQARMESDLPKELDAAAFVKDPSCGERYFTRGPSKYPVTTPHLIASNTKMYVASLILLLADDGLLSLSDPISKWIAKVPGGDAITVRQTLDHSSGIYNYSDNLAFQAKWALNLKHTPQQLVDIAFKEKVYAAPGEKFHYSNTNYVILGMIAEKVGGKPLEELLRTRILEPIGAKSTWFKGKEDIPVPIAKGTTFLGGNGADFGDPSAFWAAGSFVATLDDLARWVEVRQNGSFHSAAAQKEIDTGFVVDQNLSYGAGSMLYAAGATTLGVQLRGHGGDLPGYHSYSFYLPEKKTTVVLIVDADAGEGFLGFPISNTYREKLLAAVLQPLVQGAGAVDAGAAP